MSDKDNKPYTSKRWTDIPVPNVIGQVEFTEEEKKENDKKMEEVMKAYGLLQENEHIRNSKIIKE